MNPIKEIHNLQRDGNIYLTITKPAKPEDAKAIIFINHGMGEHIDRYHNFIDLLARNDFIVYGHNHRGHKNSLLEGCDYGCYNNLDVFQTFVDDNLMIIDMIKKEYPNLPIYMFGHSMGSFITQRFLQFYGNKVNGAILCGSAKQSKPLLNMGIFYSKLVSLFRSRKRKSKSLHNLIFKPYNKKFKPNRTEVDWLNRDEKEVDIYVNDPYCGGAFSAGFYHDFFKCLKSITENYELISKDIPVFIISGDHDPVGGQGKLVSKLYKELQKNELKDLTMKLYPGARHELMLEFNKDEVMNDCLNWFNKQISK